MSRLEQLKQRNKEILLVRPDLQFMGDFTLLGCEYFENCQLIKEFEETKTPGDKTRGLKNNL
ncbi:MAG: hypothetical protein ACR2NW_09275 [Thermodesulfobacteriota bacterium]